jgi:hypothetical protein
MNASTALFIMRSVHDMHKVNVYRADRVSPHVDQRTAGRILTKFGVDVMPLDDTLK